MKKLLILAGMVAAVAFARLMLTRHPAQEAL